MPSAPSYLRNTESVVAAFGFWPGFHDAPVLGCDYDPAGGGKVVLTLHGWVMSPEVDERGFYKLTRHHLVRFAFHGIVDADLDRFNSMGNILFGLGFSSAEDFAATGRFSVRLDSALGGDLRGSFFAEAGEVLEVVPCGADGWRAGSGPPPEKVPRKPIRGVD